LKKLIPFFTLANPNPMTISTLLFATLAARIPYLIAIVAATIIAGVVMRRRSDPKTDPEE
jgi:hypothetical protein